MPAQQRASRAARRAIAAMPLTNSVSPSDFCSCGPSARYISGIPQADRDDALAAADIFEQILNRYRLPGRSTDDGADRQSATRLEDLLTALVQPVRPDHA
jgi:hypothetical protein